MPSCEHLYACDYRWWKQHIEEVECGYRGIRWTQDVQWNEMGCTPAAEWGIRQLKSINEAGLSRTQGVIHQGQNSGYQALNLAYLLGAERILLLGYDMKSKGDQRHWFGAYPNGLEVASDYPSFINRFSTIKPEAYNLEIWNVTRETNLQVFPIHDLDAVCAALS